MILDSMIMVSVLSPSCVVPSEADSPVCGISQWLAADMQPVGFVLVQLPAQLLEWVEDPEKPGWDRGGGLLWVHCSLRGKELIKRTQVRVILLRVLLACVAHVSFSLQSLHKSLVLGGSVVS